MWDLEGQAATDELGMIKLGLFKVCKEPTNKVRCTKFHGNRQMRACVDGEDENLLSDV